MRNNRRERRLHLEAGAAAMSTLTSLHGWTGQEWRATARTMHTSSMTSPAGEPRVKGGGCVGEGREPRVISAPLGITARRHGAPAVAAANLRPCCNERRRQG